MKRRTTADFGPLDFAPLMVRAGEGYYPDPAVSFDSEEEALYFLDQVEMHFEKCFGNRNGYWKKDRPDVVYIPRLYEVDHRSMTYSYMPDSNFLIFKFSDLVMESLEILELSEGEFDEILV